MAGIGRLLDEVGISSSVKRVYAETGLVGRTTTLCARVAEIGALGRIDLVHGPAETITSVAGITFDSPVDFSVYVTDSTASPEYPMPVAAPIVIFAPFSCASLAIEVVKW